MPSSITLNAGHRVSVRRTRLNVLVLLTLALAGESPTCPSREYKHPVTRAIELLCYMQLAKRSKDSNPFWSISHTQLKCIFLFHTSKYLFVVMYHLTIRLVILFFFRFFNITIKPPL